MFWFFFFWWVFAGVAYLLKLPPGPMETLINFVLGLAGAAVSTVCLRMCWDWFWAWLPWKPRRKGIVTVKGRAVMTDYKRVD